jgi:peptidoglycan/LPS O-acetylase OafA/YrhL
MPSSPEPSRESFSQRFLAPYRRITSSGQLIPEIDGLRFIAILSVYVYHLAGDILRHSPPSRSPAHVSDWIFSTTQILNIGVPLFFVISGFILGLPFAAAHLQDKRPVSLKKYFVRRLTRLEPPYILALLLFFALKVVGARGTAHELLPNLLASTFYVHNLVYGSASVINFVAWSLEIEVQFYILAPLLACVFAIHNSSLRRAILTGALLLATGVSLLVSGTALGLSLLGNAQYFLAGFVLVDLHFAGLLPREGAWRWDLVSLAGWPILLALLVWGGVGQTWATPWLILVLYVAAFRGHVTRQFVSNPWVETIGGMCYTIYLLHNYLVVGAGMITERVFASASFEWRLAVQFVLITPFVLTVSAVYFRWVERPCMRPDWPRRLRAAFAASSPARYRVAASSELSPEE